MTDRKSRPLWPLLTAALIGLPVLYVASYTIWFKWAAVEGPFERPYWVKVSGQRIFWPLCELIRASSAFREGMNQYMAFWGETEIDWFHGRPPTP